MRKSSMVVSAFLVSSLFLSSCASDGSFTRQDFTTVAGAIGGGILGSNVGKGKGRMVGAAVGALAGAAAGKWLGDNLDNPRDRSIYQDSTQNALETAPIGNKVSWNNPDTGASGYTQPVKTYKSNGRYCREYTQTIIIGGKKQEAVGTACRTEGGHWEIQE